VAAYYFTVDPNIPKLLTAIGEQRVPRHQREQGEDRHYYALTRAPWVVLVSFAPIEQLIPRRLVALVGYELNIGQFEYLWPTVGQVIYKVTLREHWDPNYERPEETPHAGSRLLRQWFLGSRYHVEPPEYPFPIREPTGEILERGRQALEDNLQRLKAAAFDRQRRGAASPDREALI